MSATTTDALKIARRYATASFALARELEKEAVVVQEMTQLAKLIEGHAELAETLNNPVITVSQKADVLAKIVKTGDPLTQRAVATITEGGRAALIPQIADQLQVMLTAHQGEVEAVVTSARALPAATQQRISQSIAKATGKKVRLSLRQDAKLLGGLTIQVGSMRLDATLSGALNNMRERLLATTN